MRSGIASTLGGTKTLHHQVRDGADFDLLIREGLPWEAGNFLKESLRLTDKEFARILGVSERTLSRLRKGGERIPSVASDRLYRLARIFSMAKEVLEDEGQAREWLHRPQIGLGGRVPLDMTETDAGTSEVENLLGRIEHGVLA